MTALWVFSVSTAPWAFNRNTFDRESPPKPRAPTLRNARRDMPSQNLGLRPKKESMAGLQEEGTACSSQQAGCFRLKIRGKNGGESYGVFLGFRRDAKSAGGMRTAGRIYCALAIRER